MKSVPLLSSQDGSGRVQPEGFGPTRNWKVEGSNPSPGSISAGQRAFLALLTTQRQQPVIPLGGLTRRRRAHPASLPRCGARLPAGRGSEPWTKECRMELGHSGAQRGGGSWAARCKSSGRPRRCRAWIGDLPPLAGLWVTARRRPGPLARPVARSGPRFLEDEQQVLTRPNLCVPCPCPRQGSRS
jgi:hypothetical protein